MIDLFEAKVCPEPNTGCHLWTAHTNRLGYGRYGDALAHRVAWERERGPIPRGLFVCHGCDTPACVNLTHLFLGTHADNMRDMRRKGRSGRALSAEGAGAIRTRLASGEAVADLARAYGVVHATVWKIANGVTWKEVPCD